MECDQERPEAAWMIDLRPLPNEGSRGKVVLTMSTNAQFRSFRSQMYRRPYQ